uniref:Uncharacterized protein n=1 Tax=Bosea sp. NBC_00436 TaxID=2969620 RepID=A0A9E7ZTB6_9HYPH
MAWTDLNRPPQHLGDAHGVIAIGLVDDRCDGAPRKAPHAVSKRLRVFPMGHGTEFAAKAAQGSIGEAGAKTAYIARGSPWENGFIGRLKVRSRETLSTRNRTSLGSPTSPSRFWPSSRKY